MEFEELKKVWDSQNNKPMYVIDEKSMDKIVIKKSKAASRKANIFEFGIIAITTFVTVFMLTKGVLEQEWTNFLTALASFGITLYIIINRIRRRRLENQFGQSLLDGLDNAITNINYLLKQASTFKWWYLLPFGVTSLVSMIVRQKPVEAWILVGVAFILGFIMAQYSVRKEYLPKKKSLEALRRTLTQEGDYADMK